MAYSAFARIHDLSKYNLEEIKQFAHTMDMRILEKGLYQLVEWSDKNTSMIIEFHLDGRFHKIVQEVWKDEDQVFTRQKILDKSNHQAK